MAKKTTQPRSESSIPSNSSAIASVRSRGNVFADLGLPHPEQELLKSRLTLQICRLDQTAWAEAGRRGHNPRHQAAACLGSDAKPRRIFLG
jgi:hypothetical protein